MRLMLCAALFFPATGLAACPVASDMDKGVMFKGTDGAHQVVRKTAPDMVEMIETDDGGYAYRMMFAKGIYFAETTDLGRDNRIDHSSRMLQSYTVPFADLPQPKEGVPLAPFTLTGQMFSFGQLDPVTEAYRFQDEIVVTLSGCAYRALPYEVTVIMADDNPVIFDQIYVYAFKASYARRVTFVLDDGTTDVREYETIGIGRVADD